MRFLFITAALLLFSYAMAKKENKAPNDKPLTEEEAKEVVFSVAQEMAKEIVEAVKTINDVFGNPDCSKEAKRGIFWGERRKRAAEDLELEKRGWGEALAGAAAVALIGKRSETESESKLEKRGIFWGERRNRATEDLKLEKRGWGDFWKGAAAAAVIGKRSETESESKVEKRFYHTFPHIFKRSNDEKDDSTKAEKEFRADIAKLERALEVLNDVLQIAIATAESE